MDIGIVSEGVTDQIIIEAIVQGHLKNKDIILEALQPRLNEPGGWPLVISYCKSQEFRQSFPYRDGFTIIHIDCDIFKRDGLPKDCIMDLNGLDCRQTYEMIRNKLLEFIDIKEDEIAEKIIFAVAVDQTECWFLPLYHQNKPKTANKTSGCIDTLNRVLTEQEGFYIKAKDPENYIKISKHLTKNKNVKLCYDMNESFRIFIDEFNRGHRAHLDRS